MLEYRHSFEYVHIMRNQKYIISAAFLYIILIEEIIKVGYNNSKFLYYIDFPLKCIQKSCYLYTRYIRMYDAHIHY